MASEHASAISVEFDAFDHRRLHVAPVASPVERELQRIVWINIRCELAVESCAPFVGLEAHLTVLGVDMARRLVEGEVFVMEP